MRKEDVDRLLRDRPFRPFEVRLVDGRTYFFNSPEQLIVTRSTIHTLDKHDDAVFISLSLISTMQVYAEDGTMQPV